MIRIIMVEDDELLATTVRRLLLSDGELEVIACHGSAEKALEAGGWTEGQVLICDLGLPGMSGVDLISRVRDLAPELVILAYTLFEDQETVFSALRAGASGYLLKGCSATDLKDSVRRIHAGESPMSPAIARRLLDRFLAMPADIEPVVLTSREETIVRLLADGKIYKEVGDQLGISPHTVHSHIKKIYGKLHVADRSEAIRRAGELGYLKPKSY